MSEKKNKLNLIGYWMEKGIENPKYPDPNLSAFQCVNWEEYDKNRVCQYLKDGKMFEGYFGFSSCRICNKLKNGALELTDGVWVWPEGLAHYVECHDILLPEEFFQHILSNNGKVPNLDIKPNDYEVSEKFWLEWTRKQG